jgi:hypothetical protein
VATNNYLTQLNPLATYNPGVQQSAIAPVPVSAFANGMTYNSLAQAADRERQMSMQRAAGRQQAVIGGYDQQIANNRMLGDQAYQSLAGNYDAIAADAAATRARNDRKPTEVTEL